MGLDDASGSHLDAALTYLLKHEGGWSDHPNDRGGKTMYGVTQGTYDQWRTKKKRPKQSVRGLTKLEAREIYEEMYWRAAGCDRLPWPISYITFDAAVNSGPVRALKWTQAGLKIPSDGKIGPTTIGTAQRVVESGNGQALLDILDQRVVFLARRVQRSPDQAAFLLGWWRRTMQVLGIALLTEPEE